VSIAPESLGDLIETRSTRFAVPQRKLWEWVFNAILSGTLVLYCQSDDTEFECVSLDTEFKHGGRQLTWRRVIADVLPSIRITGCDPLRWNWTTRLAIPPQAFDKCLKVVLQDFQIVAHPKRRAGRKGEMRKTLSEFITEHFPNGPPPGKTRKEIAEMAKSSLGRRVCERTVSRALGRK
jgi:hypothetical protein